MAKKLNCWDYFKCGKEIGNAERDLDFCSVSILQAINPNGGMCAGRQCWRVLGSHCYIKEMNFRGTANFKRENCDECEFKALVKEEEGEDFKE